MADRGFGETKLYDFLNQALGFYSVMRFRGNIKQMLEEKHVTLLIGLVQMAEQKHSVKLK